MRCVAAWHSGKSTLRMSAWQPQNASFESFSRKKNIKGQEALELNSPHSPNEGFQKQVASWGIVQAVRMKPMQSQHLLTKTHHSSPCSCKASSADKIEMKAKSIYIYYYYYIYIIIVISVSTAS